MQNDRLTMTFAIRHFYDFIMTLKHNGDVKKNQGCYCQREYIRYNAQFIKAVKMSGLTSRRQSIA
jgi:hypothetical protein